MSGAPLVLPLADADLCLSLSLLSRECVVVLLIVMMENILPAAGSAASSSTSASSSPLRLLNMDEWSIVLPFLELREMRRITAAFREAGERRFEDTRARRGCSGGASSCRGGQQQRILRSIVEWRR